MRVSSVGAVTLAHVIGTAGFFINVPTGDAIYMQVCLPGPKAAV
jgi:hypothetical protein